MSLRITVIGAEAISGALHAHRESVEAIEKMELALGASAPYAGYVHGGTSRMPPRPFLSNAIQKNLADLQLAIVRAIPKGDQETVKAILRGANDIVDDAREEAPVRTGYLRGSLYVKLR